MTLYKRARAKIRPRWRRFRGYCDFPHEPWGNKVDRTLKKVFLPMIADELYDRPNLLWQKMMERQGK